MIHGGNGSVRMVFGEAEDASGVAAQLRIVATTDLHVHLLPHDYYADRPAATGLALAGPVIRRLRAEARASGAACLLVDDGDFLEGSLLSDWLANEGQAENGASHPMVAAMNALSYDAGTLGNHEFNYGLPYLTRALAGAAFPVVSANVLTDEGSPLIRPWTILRREVVGSDGQRHLVRVGVLGLAPPQITAWDRLILGGRLRTRDIVDTAREEVPRLRAAGADIVVALCHSGIGAGAAEPMMENAAVPLAAIPGLDAVVAGHTHEVFPDDGQDAPAAVDGAGNRAADEVRGGAVAGAVDRAAGTLHGRPAVQAGAYGSHVGVLDLWLRRGRDSWRVAGHAARAERVPREPRSPEGLPIDPEVAAIAAPFHARLLDAARRPVGRTEVALQSYFSLVGGDATIDVVADAQRIQAARLLAGTPAASLPILSAVAPFRAGGRGGPRNYIDIPPGPLALRQAAELYVHPNGFVVVEITGAGLREWLERSASMFCTLSPGVTDQPLIDPAFPSYNFETIDGLTWAVDPTRPPRTDAKGRVINPHASRVLNLRQGSRSVADRDRFALATNSYRLGLGGAFEAAAATRRLHESSRHVRDLVMAHVRAAPVRPPPRPRWRFEVPPGTAAWFDSGPGALAHLGAVEAHRIAPLGPAPGGFWRFRLTF